MNPLRWLQAVLGNTKLEERLEASRTELAERLESELRRTLTEQITADVEERLRRDEDGKGRPELELVTPQECVECTCGCRGFRIDLVHSAIVYDGVELTLEKAGAAVTCPRCGRSFAVDERGIYEPHRDSWPSAWEVRAQVGEAQAQLSQRQTQRAVRAPGVRARSPISDMRQPPA